MTSRFDVASYFVNIPINKRIIRLGDPAGSEAEAMKPHAGPASSSTVYLYCLLAVFVLCSVTLTWDTPLIQPYHQHYVGHATYHGVDVFTEDLNSPSGPEHFMEHFYICYGRDGRKTYYKKLDQLRFSNRRFWVISASGSFIASMKTCWPFSSLRGRDMYRFSQHSREKRSWGTVRNYGWIRFYHGRLWGVSSVSGSHCFSSDLLTG